MSSGKDESISAIREDDLDSIPEYLRAGIQKIIEKRVAQRVDEGNESVQGGDPC